MGENMELIIVIIEAPQETNLILGQTHFIKSVEDLYEAMATMKNSKKPHRAGVYLV